MQLEVPTHCDRAGTPFIVVPNCIPGPIAIQVALSKGGVIQDKVTPSLRAQSLEGDSAVSHQQPQTWPLGKEWVPGAWRDSVWHSQGDSSVSTDTRLTTTT